MNDGDGDDDDDELDDELDDDDDEDDVEDYELVKELLVRDEEELDAENASRSTRPFDFIPTLPSAAMGRNEILDAEETYLNCVPLSLPTSIIHIAADSNRCAPITINCEEIKCNTLEIKYENMDNRGYSFNTNNDLRLEI